MMDEMQGYIQTLEIPAPLILPQRVDSLGLRLAKEAHSERQANERASERRRKDT